MKGFLGVAIAVLLAAGGLAVALDRRSDRPVVRTPVREPLLRPGQTEVTGTATAVRARPAAAPPLSLPLSIERGAAATISGALVGGQRVAIAWDGGTPLHLRGEGAGLGLDVTPAPVEVGAGVVRWFLDGQPRGFVPGRYTIASPVAVGASGLATPRGSVSFEADGQTAMATSGNAVVKVGGAAVVLEGPGVVELAGEFRVRTPEGVGSAASLSFAEGPYRLELIPAVGGSVQVLGLFQGRRSG